MKRALIPLLSILLVFIGLIFWQLRDRTDRGFLQESCGPLQWYPLSFPIPVYVAASEEDMDRWLPSIVKAMQTWNAYGKFFVFGTEEKPPAFMPYVAVLVDPDIATHGATTLNWASVATVARPESSDVPPVPGSCRIRRAMVQLPGRLSDPGTDERIVTHELGHVLGLAHDESESSVMYPVALGGYDYGITDKDADLLQRTYLVQK